MANHPCRAAALVLCFLLSHPVLAEVKSRTPEERAAALISSHDSLVKIYKRVEYRDANRKAITKDAFMRGAIGEQRPYQIDIEVSTEAPSMVSFKLEHDPKPGTPVQPTKKQ